MLEKVVFFMFIVVMVAMIITAFKTKSKIRYILPVIILIIIIGVYIGSGYRFSPKSAAESFSFLEKKSELITTIKLDDEDLYIFYNPDAKDYNTVRVTKSWPLYRAGEGVMYRFNLDDDIRTVGGMGIAGPGQSSLSYYVINDNETIKYLGFKDPYGTIVKKIPAALGEGIAITINIANAQNLHQYQLIGLDVDGAEIAYYGYEVGDTFIEEEDYKWYFLDTDQKLNGDSDGYEKEEGDKTVTNDEADYTPEDSKHPMYNVVPGPIEDEKVLNYLWQQYFDGVLSSLLNSRTFETASEIEPMYLGEYVGRKYFVENGVEEFSDKDSNYKYIPVDFVMPLIKKYFNLDEFDVSGLDDFTYNSELDALYINSSGTEFVTNYNDSNGWGYLLENVQMLDNGDIYCELNTYFMDMGSLDRSFQVTLSSYHNNSGEYYFGKATTEYYYVSTVEIIGDYESSELFDAYVDEGDYFQAETNYLGEDDDTLILNMYVHGIGGNHKLVALDKKTLQFSNEMIIKDYSEDVFHSINVIYSDKYGKVIKIMNDDTIQFYSFNMELLEEIPVPETIRKNIVQFDDDNSNLGKGFFGYDISKDLQYMTYSNKKGLYLYNMNTKEEKLIQPTLEFEGEFGSFHYINQPEFVGGNNVFATVQGWEWSDGYVFYHMKKDEAEVIQYTSVTERVINIGDNQYYTVYEYGDDKGGTWEQKPYLLNLQTGEHEGIPTYLQSVNFAYYYDSQKVGYPFGTNGFLIGEKDLEAKNYEGNESMTTLYFVDYDGNTSEPLIIKNAYFNILFFCVDETGKVQVFISYDSYYNERDIIKWDTGMKVE